MSTEDAVIAPHSFEQAEGVAVHICRWCAQWPLHHLHDQDKGVIDGLSLPCTCDACREDATG